MRTTFCSAIPLCVVLSFASSVLAQDDPQALVKKGIQAAGGEEKLAKAKAMTWKETGVYYGMGDGIDYQGNYALQKPDKYRMEIVGFMTMVINGDKGWVNSGGNVQEMDKDQLAEGKEGLYAMSVASLLPLKEKAFTLKAAGDAQVDGKPAAAVIVSSQGHGDVKLFFDKQSGLVVKAERRAKAGELGGQEVTQEVIYSNHKDVEGIKVAMKILILRDGKKYVEATHSDFKLADKLDEATFSKP